MTVVPARVPARLSQKMLLNSSGLLKSRRAARQRGLQLVAVGRGRQPGRGRVTVGGHRGGRRQVLHDRVVVDPHVGGVVEADAAALVGRHVVDDHVVVDVHREVARPSGSGYRRRRRWPGWPGSGCCRCPPGRSRARASPGVGRQLTGDHDAAALVVGHVEVDAVVVDLAVRAESRRRSARRRTRARSCRRCRCGSLRSGPTPAKRPMPPARLVPALAMIRLLAMRTSSLCWLVSGAGRSGVPMRMVP